MSQREMFNRWYWRLRSTLLERGMEWEGAKRVTPEQTRPFFDQQIRPDSVARLFTYRPEAAA